MTPGILWWSLLWEQLKLLTHAAVFVFPHCSKAWLWEGVEMEVECSLIKWEARTKDHTAKPGCLSSNLLNCAPHSLPICNPPPPPSPLPRYAESTCVTHQASCWAKHQALRERTIAVNLGFCFLEVTEQDGNDGRGGSSNSIASIFRWLGGDWWLLLKNSLQMLWC